MKKFWEFVICNVVFVAFFSACAYYCDSKDKEEKKAEEEMLAKYAEKHEAKGKYIYIGNDGNVHA